MSKFNYFDRILISSTNFSDHLVSFGFNTAGFAVVNESTTDGATIEYSFDGTTIAGDLIVGGIDGIVFDARHESKIWFRISGGTSCNVRIEAWG